MKSKRNPDPHGQAGHPRNYATLCIVMAGPSQDPDLISQRLAITPTRTQQRGTAATGKTHTSKPRHQSVGSSWWVLSTQGLPLSDNQQEHVAWLLGCLQGKEDLVRQLRAEGHWVCMVCHWYIEHGQPALPAETTQRLDDLDITLDFELER